MEIDLDVIKAQLVIELCRSPAFKNALNDSEAAIRSTAKDVATDLIDYIGTLIHEV